MGTIFPTDLPGLEGLFRPFSGRSIKDMQNFLHTGETCDRTKFRSLHDMLLSSTIGAFKVEHSIIDNGEGTEEYLIIQVL